LPTWWWTAQEVLEAFIDMKATYHWECHATLISMQLKFLVQQCNSAGNKRNAL